MSEIINNNNYVRRIPPNSRNGVAARGCLCFSLPEEERIFVGELPSDSSQPIPSANGTPLLSRSNSDNVGDFRCARIQTFNPPQCHAYKLRLELTVQVMVSDMQPCALTATLDDISISQREP